MFIVFKLIIEYVNVENVMFNCKDLWSDNLEIVFVFIIDFYDFRIYVIWINGLKD